jgi:Domain of unknown function (DUF4304)
VTGGFRVRFSHHNANVWETTVNDEVQGISLPGSPAQKQESRDAQKVLRILAKALRPLGFERTKPTFFTRQGKYVVEFVHLHKYTFGPMFRVHLGVRVRSDQFPAVALNGPAFDTLLGGGAVGASRRFEFRSDPDAVATCAELLRELIATTGEEWFHEFNKPAGLLSADTSPLSFEAIAALRVAVNGPETIGTSPQTRRALNVD